MKDYYKILELEKGASESDIKKSYYKLAHKYHPDKGGDEKKMKEINEAYQVLSDKKKREQYDNYGTTFDNQGFNPGQQGGFSSNWGDFSNVEDIFEQFFGGGQPHQHSNEKNYGRDIKAEIEINLEDILKGLEKEVSIKTFVFCSDCQGSGGDPGAGFENCYSCKGTGTIRQIRKTILGSFATQSTCPECEGTGKKPKKYCKKCSGEGRVKDNKKIKFKIPAGIRSNQIIRIDREGEAGRRGGDPGDFYVRIIVKPHSIFKRKEDDLFIKIPMSFSQAVLGDKIDIPTIEGKKVVLKVPAGTESGKVFKISNKGVPRFSRYGKGDLYVELNIKTPKSLNKNQKKIIEELNKEGL